MNSKKLTRIIREELRKLKSKSLKENRRPLNENMVTVWVKCCDSCECSIEVGTGPGGDNEADGCCLSECGVGTPQEPGPCAGEAKWVRGGGDMMAPSKDF